MKRALLLAALLLSSARARAGAVLYELDPEIREQTMQLVRDQNVNYHKAAAERLRKKGRHFNIARLEVKGMLAADDTRKFSLDDFDDNLEPSFKADKGRGVMDWIRSWGGRDFNRDKDEMRTAMRGEMSARAKDTVARLKGLEINEIVAHSWGSELMYAAILNGDVRPPKKLIVVGVPDDDLAKWEMLAARTGTELFWARADNDAAAMDEGARTARKAAGDVDFKARWDAACAKDKGHALCRAHGRKPKPMVRVNIGRLPGLLGHDRAEYYKAIKRLGVIKTSVPQMRAAEDVVIAAEAVKVEQDLLTSAHREAIKLVAESRELARRRAEAMPKPSFWDNIDLDEFQRRMAELKRIGPAQGAGPSVPVNSGYVPPPPFAHHMARFRSFAVEACRSPENVPMGHFLTPYYDHSFRDHDNALAQRMSAGLDACSQRLFYRLIEMVRDMSWRQADRAWIREAVELYSRPPQRSDPLPSVGGNGGGGNGGGNRGGGEVSPAPPPVRHDAEGEALRQLQEIERRKRWGLRPVM